MRKAVFAGSGLVLASLLMAGAAGAKDKEPRRNSPLVNALAACRQIPDAAQRLACFDKASGDLLAATEKGDLNVVDRAELRQARKSLFGFTMPRLPFFAGDKSADDVSDKLNSKVTAVKEMPYGRVQVRIAEGNAVWETLETNSSFDIPKVGDTIEIRRGALGGYTLQFGRQRGVKGRRVG
jgi:hypothetical protein